LTGKILITGGLNESGWLCEEHTIATGTNAEIAKLNVPRYYHASVGFNDRHVYVFAGETHDERQLSSIEMLDVLVGCSAWVILSINQQTFPARAGCGAVQVNDEIVVFGGGAQLSFLYRVDIFHPLTGTFKQGTELKHRTYPSLTPILYHAETIYAAYPTMFTTEMFAIQKGNSK
jgi:hypothetical protein